MKPNATIFVSLWPGRFVRFSRRGLPSAACGLLAHGQCCTHQVDRIIEAQSVDASVLAMQAAG